MILLLTSRDFNASLDNAVYTFVMYCNVDSRIKFPYTITVLVQPSVLNIFLYFNGPLIAVNR